MQIKLRKHPKLYGLLGVLALCLILSVFYLFQTLGLWSEVKTLDRRLQEAILAPQLIASKRSQVANLDNEIQTLQAREVQIGSHLEFLVYTENLCHDLNLRLIDLPTEEIEALNDYRLAHIRLRISGTFHELLQFLYRVEQSDRSATVSRSDLRLQSIRTPKGRKEVLCLSVTLNRLLENQPTTQL